MMCGKPVMLVLDLTIMMEMNLIYVGITRAINNLHMRAGVYGFIKKLAGDTEDRQEEQTTNTENVSPLIIGNEFAIA